MLDIYGSGMFKSLLRLDPYHVIFTDVTSSSKCLTVDSHRNIYRIQHISNLLLPEIHLQCTDPIPSFSLELACTKSMNSLKLLRARKQ